MRVDLKGTNISYDVEGAEPTAVYVDGKPIEWCTPAEIKTASALLVSRLRTSMKRAVNAEKIVRETVDYEDLSPAGKRGFDDVFSSADKMFADADVMFDRIGKNFNNLFRSKRTISRTTRKP